MDGFPRSDIRAPSPVAMLAGAAVVGLVSAARPRAALAGGRARNLRGDYGCAIEIRLLSGTTDAFIGSRLSWPINYANADAALVWLPLPALSLCSGPAAPTAHAGGRRFFAALAFAVGLTAESRGAALALAGAFSPPW